MTFFVVLMLFSEYAEAEAKNFLILHSYHKGLSWTDNLHQGIIEGMGETPDIEVYAEYLDTKRNALTDQLEASAVYLKQKYEKIPLDVVVISDNNALKFAIEKRKVLFPDVPLVFAGINNFSEELIQGQDNITGVVEETDSLKTVEIALNLHHDARIFHVIHDQTLTSIAEVNKLKEQLAGKFADMEFRYHTNLSTADLLKTVSEIPASDIVLLILWNKDKDGRYFSYEESSDRITKASSAPVYGLWDFYLDHGVVGGKLVSARSQGLVAAKIVRRILAGESVSFIPIEKESPNRLLFDFRELEHYKIKRASLPEGSAVVFDPIYHDPIKQGMRSTYKIGVLAKRGEQKCLERWQATADYISRKIPGSLFQIKPLGFNELRKEAANSTVDFVLTNSSYYVEMEMDYKANRIATMINKLGDFHSVHFGGVIFTKASNGQIKTLQDLSGRSFMAVDESSFGGWLAARKVLEDEGIDPYEDFQPLQFAGTHDEVVKAVMDGRVDAGTVRTDTLERMALEGKIRMEDVRIIHPMDQDGFPYVLSTELYPEWPFAAMPHVPVKVSSYVSAALLNIEENCEAAVKADIAGWTAPLPYESVRETMQQLKYGPFRDHGKITFIQLVRQYWIAGLFAVAFFIILIIFSIWAAVSKKMVKQASLDLFKSREQFLLAVNGSQDGIWDLDLRDDSLFLSEKWKSIVGYRDDELPNTFPSFMDNIHPDDQSKVHENLDRYLNGELENYFVEFRMKHKQGHYVDILARGAAIRDENGKPVRMAGSHTDITERKRAEEEILKTNENMKMAADSAGFGIWSLDLLENKLEWDEWMFRLYGVNKEDFGGAYEAWQAGVHPDDVDRSSKEVERALAGEKQFDTEFRIIRPNGEIRYLKAYGKVTRDEKGKPVRMTGINYDVTEQKQAENELVESEARFMNVLYASNDAILLIGDNMFVDCNEATAKMLGYDSREQFLQTHPSELSPETQQDGRNSREKADEMMRMAFEQGFHRFEWIHRRANGEEFPVEVSLTPIIHHGRNLLHCIWRDITEFKKIALEREAFAAVVKHSDNIVVVKDMNLRVVATNTAFALASGHSTPEELVGKTDAEIFCVSPEDEPIRSYMEDERRAQELPPGEFILREEPVILPSGEVRTVLTKKYPIFNSDGILTGTGNISTDITERKQAEKELSENEARLSAITTSAQDAIIMIDNSGAVSFWNPAAEKIMGYSNEEILKKNFHNLVVPEKFMDEHRKAFAIFRDTGEGKAIGKTHELEAKHKDGHVFPVSLSLSAVKIDNEWNAIGLLRDITEKKRAERQLLDTNRQLEEITTQAREMAVQAEVANIAKSQFLANMSHEIRTPMNAVVGMSDMLLEMDLTDRQREYVEVICKSADALLNLINDILDYSKIEADKLDIEEIDFNLRTLLEDIGDVAALRAHEKGLEFVYFLPPYIPTMLIGDPNRLRQILINLSNNAIKFTEQGEISILVDIMDSGEDDVLIRFDVKDTGIGLSQKAVEKLFQPFTQADASTTRQFGGTGLGLSISKRLSEMMGGKIGVESKEGEGSRFWFTARLKKQKDSEPTDIQMLPGDIRKERILAVDDNKSNRMVVSAMLESWDCRFDMAVNGHEALEKIFEADSVNDAYGLVILDMNMPVISGLSVGKKIRSSEMNIQPALVMLTSVGEKGDAENLKEVGFNAYLTKPIKQSQLYNCLVSVISSMGNLQQKQPAEKSVTRSRQELEHVGKSVLLVEDNMFNQMVAKEMLGKMGFSVEIANNGKIAIDKLSRKRFDIVFMDMQMPEMDGIEATGIIRDKSSGVLQHDVPIIAMTANAMKGDREACLDAGMDDYVAKPIKRVSLEEAIARTPEKSTKVKARKPAESDDSFLTITDDELDDDDLPGFGDNSIEDNISEQVVFDPDALLDRLSGDVDLMRTILAAFEEDVDKKILLLKEKLDANDSKAARLQAHAIKGAAGNAGALVMQDIALQMEDHLKESDVDQARDLLPQLRKQFNKLIDTLKMKGLIDD